MTRMLTRDPFARATLMRERLYVTECTSTRTCAWCDNVKHTKNGRAYLFFYWWESDSTMRRWVHTRRPFCSVSCWRSFEH